MGNRRGRVYLGVGTGIAGEYHRQAVAAVESLGFDVTRPFTELPLAADVPSAKSIADLLEKDPPDAVVLPLCFKHQDTPAISLDAAAILFQNEMEASRLLGERAVAAGTDSSMTDQRSLASRTVLLPFQSGSAHNHAALSTAARIEPPDVSALVKPIQARYGAAANDWAFANEEELLINIQSLLIRTLPHLAVARVMFSSSLIGMERENEEVRIALSRLGHRRGTTYELLNFARRAPTATDDLTVSLSLVRDCTVYIGAVRTRYGKTGSDGRSLTHSEYREARKLRRPRAFLFCTTPEAPDVRAPDPTDEDRKGLLALREDVDGDRHARKLEYGEPHEIRSKLIPLIDFLLRPGTDMAAAPVPDRGRVYEAHPYPLLDDERAVVRHRFLGQLERWLSGRDSPPLLCVHALGGMGKSAATWAWFRGLQRPERKRRPRLMWWSFYAPNSGPDVFADKAIEFVSRFCSESESLPPRDAALCDRLDALLRLLQSIDGTTLFVLDGIERIVRFYKEDKKRVETEGQTVEEVLERACRKEAARDGEPYEVVRRRALMFLTNDRAEALAQKTEDRDASALAKFFRDVAALEHGEARILATTRFVPTAMADLGTACEITALGGLDRTEIIGLWQYSGLIWEFAPNSVPGDGGFPAQDQPLDPALGGGSLTEILATGLQGYALPIVLLAEVIRHDLGHGATFARWKESLPSVDRGLDYRAIRSAAVARAEVELRLAADDTERERAGAHLLAARTEALVARLMWMALRALPGDVQYHKVLRTILRAANGVHLSDLYIALVRCNPREFSSEAMLDDALAVLRARKIVGYSEENCLYDIHPLLRKACWEYHPDSDEHVGEYVDEARRRHLAAVVDAIAAQGAQATGRVPFAAIEPALNVVGELIRGGTPLHALLLFSEVDKTLRFRCEGDIVARRETILVGISEELRDAREYASRSPIGDSEGDSSTEGLDAAAAAGAPSASTAARNLLAAYRAASARVDALRADNALLRGDMRGADAILPPESIPDDALGVLRQAGAALARGEYQAARTLAWIAIRAAKHTREARLMADGTADSILTWAAAELLTIEAISGNCQRAAEIAVALGAGTGGHADIEDAGLTVAVECAPPGEVSRIETAYDWYRQSCDGLHFGSLASAVRRAELEGEGLFPIEDNKEWNAQTEALQKLVAADGFSGLALLVRFAQTRVAIRIGVASDIVATSLDAIVSACRAAADRLTLGAALLERATIRPNAEDLRESIRIFAGTGPQACWRRMLDRATALWPGAKADHEAVVADARSANVAVYEDWVRGHLLAATEAEQERVEEERRRAEEARVQIESRREVGSLPPGISNTRGWTDERIADRLDVVKSGCDYQGASAKAREWWTAFERENKYRRALVLRLAEELLIRKATIQEFFNAYLTSATDNIQANLHYLEYSRVRDRAAVEPAARGVPWPPEEPPPPGVTDWRHVAEDELLPEIEIKSRFVGLDAADDSIKQWWGRYRQEHGREPRRVLRFTEELLMRRATLTEVYLARDASKIDDERGILAYMDYHRLRVVEETRKREAEEGRMGGADSTTK